MIYVIEHICLLADNYPAEQERIFLKGTVLIDSAELILIFFKIRKMMVLSIIFKILLLPKSHDEAPRLVLTPS